MKTSALIFAATLLFVLATENTSNGAESGSVVLPGNPLEGSQLFSEKGCLRCHAINGVGGAGGPDLGQGILKRSLLDIAGVMWNHSPGMAHVIEERHAARPVFKAPEMGSLLSFLYYIGSLDAPGDPITGARLFRDKQCQTCHSLGGVGGRQGPPLDGYSKFASPIFLSLGLWNRGKSMAAMMEAMGISRPTFEKNNIPDIFAYIRSVSRSVERIYVQPGSPRNGEKLFVQKRCIECHSVTPQGEPNRANLRARLVKGSFMTIAGTMWNHGPKMWADMARRGIPASSLTVEELSDIVGYLYFLQFIDPPGVAERGRVAFREKRCGRCHLTPEKGLAQKADIAKSDKPQTQLEVVTEMWNHASKMEEKMLKESLEWPVFRGGEMADLMAYLVSLRAEK